MRPAKTPFTLTILFCIASIIPSIARKTCPMVKVEARRLPTLNIPRVGHHTRCFDGELTVMGGHTTGFIPTPTAEYLKDGKWHTVNMTYPHDEGIAVCMQSGGGALGRRT